MRMHARAVSVFVAMAATAVYGETEGFLLALSSEGINLGAENTEAGFGLGFGPGSQCEVKYKDFPWSVECNLVVQVTAGDEINGGNPMTFTARVGTKFENGDTLLDSAVTTIFEFKSPDITAELPWPIGDKTFEGKQFESVMRLDKEDIDGLCFATTLEDVMDKLAQKEPPLPPQVITNGKAVAAALKFTGSDACLSLRSLDVDATGGAVWVVLGLKLFDDPNPDPFDDNFGDEIKDLLELETNGPAFSHELDLGALLYFQLGPNPQPQGRLAQPRSDETGGVIDENGRFLLGDRVVVPTDAPTKEPTDAPASGAAVTYPAANSLTVLGVLGFFVFGW